MNDPLYEACDAFLQARQTVLWADWDLTRNRDKAAAWLALQIQGVAEHYDATAPPFFQSATAPLTGPYSTEQGGGGQRPDPTRRAGHTHGQQPERW